MSAATESTDEEAGERPPFDLMTPLGHPEEAESAALLRARAIKRLEIAWQVAEDFKDESGLVGACIGSLIFDAQRLIEAADVVAAGADVQFRTDSSVSTAGVLSGVLRTCDLGSLSGEDLAELAMGAEVSALETFDHYRAACDHERALQSRKGK